MKKLELIFATDLDKTVTFSLDSPVEPVDETAVNEAMDLIVGENVFKPASGGEIIKKKAARIVDRQVADIELDIDEA